MYKEGRMMDGWEDKNRFLAEWRDSTDTLAEMFYKTVDKFGSRPGLMYYSDENWKTLTYSEWASISEEIAATLISLGIKADDNICIMAPTCPEWALSDTGISIAGACTVSIFPSLCDDEMKFILNHSKVKYIFSGNSELAGRAVEAFKDVPSLRGCICFEAGYKGDGEKTWSFEQFREKGKAFAESEPDAVATRLDSISPEDAVNTIYTSGTTGKLKAARYSHRDWVGGIWRSIQNLLDGNFWWDENAVYGSIMPLAHVMERTYGYYCMIATGSCIAMTRGPQFVLEDYQTIKPTCTVVVPRMLDRVLKGVQAKFSASPEGKKLWDWSMDVAKKVVETRTGPTGTIDMSIDHLDDLTGQLREDYIKAKEMVFDKVHMAMGGRIEFLASGGGALLHELHAAWTGMGFYVPNGYGLTETQCGLAVGHANDVKISWNAVPSPGMEMKQDIDGECLVKGLGIITEYYNDPVATAESITEDGFFRTGDIVEFDEYNILKVVDRKKGIIVMDTGKNVAAAKVEAFILSDIRIEQALILGDGRKYIAALIVPYWDAILAGFSEKGISFDSGSCKYELVNGIKTCVEVGDDLVNHPAVEQIVAEAIENANSRLADFETVKKYRILSRKFLQSRDELTPTSKMKSRIIEKNFEKEIDGLYS